MTGWHDDSTITFLFCLACIKRGTWLGVPVSIAETKDIGSAAWQSLSSTFHPAFILLLG